MKRKKNTFANLYALDTQVCKKLANKMNEKMIVLKWIIAFI